MVWFGHAFMVSVTYPHSHTRVSYLGLHGVGDIYKDESTLRRHYLRLHHWYQPFDWRVKYVVYDGERSMSTDSFRNLVRSLGAHPVPLPSGKHAHRVERKQGTIKDTCRLIKEGFPTTLPHSLVPHLVMNAVMQVNTNVSRANIDGIPPLLAITGATSMDFNHFFPLSFGDLALVHMEKAILDKAKARAVECIALYPADRPEEGHWFLNLETKMVIRRSEYTRAVLHTGASIQALRQLATRDGAKLEGVGGTVAAKAEARGAIRVQRARAREAAEGMQTPVPSTSTRFPKAGRSPCLRGTGQVKRAPPRQPRHYPFSKITTGQEPTATCVPRWKHSVRS